ncbi:hypothetical protein D0866_14757 [Hortaea werneckii]|uniref:Major facilitator superfamily (MFS) profile domain-containing protein n=1 Tax=Hortaea werneckii TaxID=91943 RepID=A0A3M6YZW9_HORWE|nr:hypothetical protein D0866_14757 [Hortaea werneckii]
MASDHRATTTDERHSKVNLNTIPDTVHLVDLDHHVQGKHAKDHQDIILVPAPSDDPDVRNREQPNHFPNHTLGSQLIVSISFSRTLPRPPQLTPNPPQDPLNWPRRRKLLSLACMCIYTWFAGIANSVVYSVETPLAEALGITVGDINAGTGYLFLLCGWGLLFWQPFALQSVPSPNFSC